MPKSSRARSLPLIAAVETDGWLRPAAYREKYGIRPTKFHALRNEGRLEIRQVDRAFYYVRDKLPAPAPGDRKVAPPSPRKPAVSDEEAR
jgi:hypothetical protein